ncbi:imidazolonepropionase [Desulfonema ishimotonii]|uniref:Imidazolonepropionase n=1 Tax=Desulfonema ishimotonii TaxID=45657 RepID=A0A401FSC4_9BACT|nr:imidazolonepropionase [Desulfonema ishimotonii]GBC59858.1 imidazolonepropionase [Desulfonema ishimotonii]
MRKLFRNANIFTPADPGRPLAGRAQGAIQVFERGAMRVRNGRIEKIGPEADVLDGLSPADVAMETDCGGACLIPGFVDPHTHMCFAERREAEFSLRLAGTPYLEILKQGGGILSSVRATRAASEADLYETTRRHVLSALRLGTTTVEIKSGYGLDTETELKMLRVIARVGRETPSDVVPTFLGAHAVPEAFRDNPDAFADLVIEEMLPAVSAQGIARFCDVFCEEGVFSVAQTRRILAAALKSGLGIKLHADEVHDLGGAGLAAELKAISADHLLAAGDAHIAAMAAAGVVANLLPGTAYSLRKPFARARKMIESGLPVALATDCNPGSSYTESMPFIFGLAVMNMEMTPSEALTAATLNAAYAVGMAGKTGSLDVGKQADFLLLDGESPAILAYHAGVSPVSAVYKHGERII